MCTLSVDIAFDDGGKLLHNGDSSAGCLGRVANATLDPTPRRVTIGGLAEPGLTSCTPILRQGTIEVGLRPLIDFSPKPTPLVANWATSLTPTVMFVNGNGYYGGTHVRLSGTARFFPAGSCTAGGFTPGTLQMEFFVDEPRGCSGFSYGVARKKAAGRCQARNRRTT